MGTCFYAWLKDDFCWEYPGCGGRDAIDEAVRAVIPRAKRVAAFGDWMVYDTDKTYPGVLLGKVKCDDLLVSGDAGGSDLQCLMPRLKVGKGRAGA